VKWPVLDIYPKQMKDRMTLTWHDGHHAKDNLRSTRGYRLGFVNNPAVSYSETRKQVPMGIAYLVITILLAAMVTFSGIGKIRHDPRIVQVIHELIGVPLKYFPLLAACEFAGALGIVLGIWWPLLGVAGH
jgi:hypothetical protein